MVKITDAVTREGLKILAKQVNEMYLPNDTDIAIDMANNMKEFSKGKESFNCGEWKEHYKSQFSD